MLSSTRAPRLLSCLLCIAAYLVDAPARAEPPGEPLPTTAEPATAPETPANAVPEAPVPAGTALAAPPPQPDSTQAPASSSPSPAAAPEPPAPVGIVPPAAPATAEKVDASATVHCPCPTKRRLPEPRFGFGALLVGAAWVDTGSLAGRLSRNGYERPDELTLGYGLELRSIGRPGGIVGLTFLGTLQEDYDGPDGLTMSVETQQFTVDIGYAPLQLEHFDLAVVGSIGGYSLDVDVEDVTTQRFDEALSAPPRAVELSSGGLILGGSLELHVKAAPFVVGLRLSSYWGKQIGGWDLPFGERATRGSRAGVQTTSLTLVFGVGS